MAFQLLFRGGSIIVNHLYLKQILPSEPTPAPVLYDQSLMVCIFTIK